MTQVCQKSFAIRICIILTFFMSLWIQNQVKDLEQEDAKRVILTIGDEITLKVEK